MKIVKVKDHPNLVKDMESKAVLNTNYAAYLEYKKQKQSVEDVDMLKEDMKQVKEMLNTIVSMLNK
jgi:hypothetical protein